MIGAFIQWPENRRCDSLSGYVIDGNGCHVWVGASNGRYGNVTIGGHVFLVHRARYEREVGPIPEGMQLDHFACDNKLCCNPLHLRPVSARENMLRANTVAAINTSKTHCPQGHVLVWRPNKKTNQRYCRECRTERDRARPSSSKNAARARRNAAARAARMDLLGKKPTELENLLFIGGGA